MRKRMTSLLLTLVMLLSLLPAMGVTASAAEPEWTSVSTYKELYDAVDKGDAKVKLVANIDTTNDNGGAGVTDQTALKFFGNDNILDLNGHTLKLVSNTGTTFINVNKDLTIQDSGTGGRIDFVYGPGVMHRTTAIYVSHASNEDIAHLTVKSGTLSSTKGGITLIESIGNLTINGGKFYAPYEVGSGGTYAIHTIHKYNDNAKTIINGGEIDGVVLIQRDDSAATGTPNYGDIPVQIKDGTFKQAVLFRWTEKGKPSGDPTEFSPAVEIAGGIFEKRVNGLTGIWGEDLSTKLTGGTFKDFPNRFGLGRGGKSDHEYYSKSLGNSIIMRGNEIRTSCDWSEADWFKVYFDSFYLDGSESNPVTVIRNAWGMKSVTLDGTTPINYAKDWYGEVERMDNSTAHTIKFEWYPLASELVNAGYTYQTKCEHYISGSTAVQQTDTIAADKTSHTITIEKGADPKVYSFDLKLNLEKNGSFVGIMHNEHIVKLVVNQAPVVEPDPSLDGTVYYTSGIVYGRSISTGTGNLPTGFDSGKLRYQWQRSTDSGNTWNNIEGETRGSYTPVAADMGEHASIRVVVTAEGYLGKIVGAAVKVSKADNNNYPEVIQLEAVQDGAGTYTSFKITNYDPNCEYVYSTTSTADWSANQISSATVTGLTSGTTYYVFARFKGTATHTAGSIVSRNSIKLFNDVPLQYVLLEGYDSGETIYIKKGESVTLKVSADPSNANSWKDITFKDDNGGAASNINIDNAEIAVSGENAASFPNGHTITITGDSKGSANLKASYSSGTSDAYGTWPVVVYDETNVVYALRLKDVYTYEDITLSENDEAELPDELPKLLPEDSGYQLEWRIVQTGGGTGGTVYKTSDDNITLENGKIKPKAAHTGSAASTRLELVAVKEGEANVKSFSQTSRFNVTVTEAPTITLTGVTVAPKQVNLDIGDSIQLSAVKEPVNATGGLSWSSDKPAVAEVDTTTSKVTAKAQGTAIITVSCGDKKATCTVTVAHTHDTEAQPWVYMDPGTHTKTCQAGDDFKMEAHNFSPWTEVDGTNHSRTCFKCKKSGESANYTETANHNWQWKVVTAATPNTAGMQHEECADCHAVKAGSDTVIPALTSIMVEHLTVAKPVKDAAAAAPTTTDSTYYVANTEWTAADGTTLAIGDKFQPGTVYTVKITLETTGAGVFSAKSTYNDIEGKKATSPDLTGDAHADSVILTYTFDKTAGGYHPGTGTGTGATTYPITVKSAKNGDVTASHKTASKGTAVTLTVDPDKGYVLDTLTVLDGKDKEIKLTEKNGKYTFTMPASKVTVAATFKASAPTGKNPFIDVPAGSYYEDAVVWAVEKGITSGTSAVTFDPNGNCTRAQAVTFLWRAAGSPAPKTKVMPFADVKAGSYYYDAVLWAVEQGITKGSSETMFSPDATCTRAQIVTFLWRANGSPVASGNSAFTDVASDAYYAAAVTWAEKNGITGGIGGGLFGSNNNCTRAQIVTFLYRSVK